MGHGLSAGNSVRLYLLRNGRVQRTMYSIMYSMWWAQHGPVSKPSAIAGDLLKGTEVGHY